MYFDVQMLNVHLETGSEISQPQTRSELRKSSLKNRVWFIGHVTVEHQTSIVYIVGLTPVNALLCNHVTVEHQTSIVYIVGLTLSQRTVVQSCDSRASD